ncbi:PREDICTED: ADAMTS-like protein 5 [Condylura cristata]|uniref:ADAMTS-like protein 5 n=1 Tax=Condylura cristata TaxID=143302 RepID=UPI000642A6A8|nr:PREDICTED: ADAMTS-like protein 5 [Condylura cristata]
MGKRRPVASEWPAPSHTVRPQPLWTLPLLLWTLLTCGLGGSAQGPDEWTLWGSWSGCSSTCGRGVSVRSRHCIRFSEEESCWGDTHEYRLCQLLDCPPGAVPFRDLQCALYNRHPLLDTQKTYQWIPFYGAPNQCDLNCLAEGHAFYHSFGRVLDGTPCGPDSAFAGYWNVTLIPEGARHLRVTQQSHRNHLALMGGDGSYVLNGNWVVSPPGTYQAAGTHVVYTRDESSQEMLSAVGPTSQNLILQVLLQEPNPGIQFEFWLPQELYSPFQAQTQALGWSLLRPQSREVEPQPLVTPTAPAAAPPRTAVPAPDPCPPCPDTRGRAHRLTHYCSSDFVFRAQVLGHLRQAQESRYEVRVQLVYKNRSPLRALEYLWAPGRCPCPLLALHREYLLAAQRLVSPDGTQDRLLLPHAGYGRPWSPAEDSRIRLVARHCPV